MSQHENDPAAPSAGDDHASDAEHKAASVIRFDVVERQDDEASPAPIASETPDAGDDQRVDDQEQEAIGGASVPPSSAAILQPAAAPRKKNAQRFTLLAATLGLLTTAGAVGAYHFRDRHEKLEAFATIVDETFARPERVIALARETSLGWLGDAARRGEKAANAEPETPPAHVEPEKKADAEKPGVTTGGGNERITWSAPKQVEPEKRTDAEADAKKPDVAASGNEKVTWSAPTPPVQPTAPVPIAAPPPPVAAESKAAVATPDSDAVDALTKRLDRLEQIARSALQAAEEARASAPAPAPAAPAPTNAAETQDAIAGLEGRIDELADEIKALREKLDSPKSETRLPRELAENRGSGEESKTAGPAAIVVVAHSLQKALERGAPFTSEYAALTAQGADAGALAALAPLAERGAPTAKQLRASFHSLVKQLEAIVEPKSDAPLGDRLLHGVGKLVKVRPAGDQPAATVAEIIAKIEAALDHDEVAAALGAFEELPEKAKSLAREWAETARDRLEAEKAAATILSGAIAALGKSKS